MREFTKRRGDMDLALFLKGTHTAAISLRRSANQYHRPAVLLCICQSSQTVYNAGSRHGNTGARATCHVTIRLRSVGCGLLVSHADIVDAFLLCRCRNRSDRKADNAEKMVNTLLFRASCHQGRAINFAHLIHIPFFPISYLGGTSRKLIADVIAGCALQPHI